MDDDIIEQVTKALAANRRVTVADYYEAPLGPSLEAVTEVERRVKAAQASGDRVVTIHGPAGAFPAPPMSVDRQTAIKLKALGVKVERGGEDVDDEEAAAFWSRLGA